MDADIEINSNELRNEVDRKRIDRFYDPNYRYDPSSGTHFKNHVKSNDENIIIEKLSNSTTHGISHIAQSKEKFKKLMWVAFTIASSSLCAYIIFEGVSDYLLFDVTTKIRSINQLPASFPTITICNSNTFTTDYALQIIREVILNSSLVENKTNLSGFFDPLEANFLSQEDNFERSIYATRSFVSSERFTIENRKLLGHTLDEMLISCTYSYFPCSLDDFIWYFDFYYGNCYIFNSGKNSTTGERIESKTIARSGKYDGLILELYAGVKNDSQTLNMNRGIHIKVHNYTNLPSTIDGINAPVGMEANIAIKRTFHYQLPYPYSECLIDLENPSKNKITSYLYDIISNSNYSYSQVYCFDQYYEQMVIDECKCYDLVYVNLLEAPKPCLTMEELECSDGVFNKFINMDINRIAGSLCPLECSTISYETISSYTQFPSKTYADVLMNKPEIVSVFKNDSNLTYEKLKENIVRINLYYESTKYTFVDESPATTIIQLLSNIGGTMGLFMGVSVLSFIEMIDIVFHLLQNWFKKGSNYN